MRSSQSISPHKGAMLRGNLCLILRQEYPGLPKLHCIEFNISPPPLLPSPHMPCSFACLRPQAGTAQGSGS